MSTKLAVNQQGVAVATGQVAQRWLAPMTAMALWMAAACLSALAAWRAGVRLDLAAGAAALAIAPAFLFFVLAPRLHEAWARYGLVGGWILAAAGLVAGAGGAGSPAAATFLIAPALAALLGGPGIIATAGTALLAYAAAVALATTDSPMGPFGPLLAGASLLLAAALIAVRHAPLPAGLALVRLGPDGAVIAATATGERLWRLVSIAQAQAALAGKTSGLLHQDERVFGLSAARDGDGGALLQFHDVTEWNARARFASTRAAEAAHELRTPLTHILGFSEMMQAQVFGPLDERYVEYAGLIRMSGAHLLDLVNGLLDLSRIEAGRYELELETFDARDLIHDVVRGAHGAAEPKKVALSEDLPATPLSVRADPRALRQMLINIVGNAVKFTPEGGHVRVRAWAEGDRLVIETADNGPGIPAEERARLGKPYERGARTAHVEGSGLGLAVVQAFAHLHGGALSFDDAPEGGALVRLDLPVLSE